MLLIILADTWVKLPTRYCDFLSTWIITTCFFLLGQGPVSIEEFFADPKNGTLETKKPPAMRVVEVALAYSIEPPVLQ